jgi:hypothetical protein
LQKTLFTVLLIFLLSSGLFLFYNLEVGLAQGVSFGGIIGSDTTWTLANSPYNITGNILVNNGVTLTIEPGVTVNLNGFYILVNGTLQARGTNQTMISFNTVANHFFANPHTNPSLNSNAYNS